MDFKDRKTKYRNYYDYKKNKYYVKKRGQRLYFDKQPNVYQQTFKYVMKPVISQSLNRINPAFGKIRSKRGKNYSAFTTFFQPNQQYIQQKKEQTLMQRIMNNTRLQSILLRKAYKTGSSVLDKIIELFKPKESKMTVFDGLIENDKIKEAASMIQNNEQSIISRTLPASNIAQTALKYGGLAGLAAAGILAIPQSNRNKVQEFFKKYIYQGKDVKLTQSVLKQIGIHEDDIASFVKFQQFLNDAFTTAGVNDIRIKEKIQKQVQNFENQQPVNYDELVVDVLEWKKIQDLENIQRQVKDKIIQQKTMQQSKQLYDNIIDQFKQNKSVNFQKIDQNLLDFNDYNEKHGDIFKLIKQTNNLTNKLQKTKDKDFVRFVSRQLNIDDQLVSQIPPDLRVQIYDDYEDYSNIQRNSRSRSAGQDYNKIVEQKLLQIQKYGDLDEIKTLKLEKQINIEQDVNRQQQFKQQLQQSYQNLQKQEQQPEIMEDINKQRQDIESQMKRLEQQRQKFQIEQANIIRNVREQAKEDFDIELQKKEKEYKQMSRNFMLQFNLGQLSSARYRKQIDELKQKPKQKEQEIQTKIEQKEQEIQYEEQQEDEEDEKDEKDEENEENFDYLGPVFKLVNVSDEEYDGDDFGNGPSQTNDKSDQQGLVLQTFVYALQDILDDYNIDYNIQILYQYNQDFEITDDEFQIYVLFLGEDDDSDVKHYSVLIFNQIKNPNELVFFDPLGTQNSYIYKRMKNKIQKLAIRLDDENVIKFKTNMIPLQDKNVNSTQCGQFTLLFIDDYIQNGFNFKEASTFSRLSIDQQNLLKKLNPLQFL